MGNEGKYRPQYTSDTLSFLCGRRHFVNIYQSRPLRGHTPIQTETTTARSEAALLRQLEIAMQDSRDESQKSID